VSVRKRWSGVVSIVSPSIRRCSISWSVWTSTFAGLSVGNLAGFA
jgi:hypothetical protein